MSSAHRPGGPEADPPPAESPTSTGATLARDTAQAAHGAAHGLAPGVVLASRFRIVSLLGRGGMGEVYRAEDLKLGQAVALKFLPDPIDQAKLRRFYDEVRLGRQVAHPNVCRIYDVIEAEGRHFLVMEYVDGEDLASLLRRIGRLPQDKGLEIARGLGAGLAAAHEKGILHRDLKPANVMIDGRGQARITDFGLAALAGETHGDERAGTPAYMAPEQIGGAEVTVRTDLYSLGLVLYEVFTGRRAWDAGSMAELLKRRSDSSPTTPSSLVPELDRGVERVIMACLAREASERPRSALAVLAALPGGDPLQAALALGETPSPEMVAAASVAGDLSARAAWAWLAAAAVALAGVLWLAERVMLHRLIPLPKSPEVLLDRAKTLAARLAPGDPVADSAWGFEVDQEELRHIAERDRSAQRWTRLSQQRPGPLLFWYRASAQPLVARTWVRRLGYGARPVGRVTRQEPAPTLPGMHELTLDPSGRLVRWRRVPSREDARDAELEPKLSALFAEAGLDQARLTRDTAAGGAAGATLVWRGAFPDVSTRARVEASIERGRLSLFEVARDDRPQVPSTSVGALIDATREMSVRLLLLLGLPVNVALFVLVFRNLRLKRGDRRGAFRIALFGALTASLALKLGVHFPPSLFDAQDLWLATDVQAVAWAAAGWALYIALEPALRRTWPHTLISWSRLLAGRWRDPLIGRDVLLGVTTGLALHCLFLGGDLVPLLLGRPQLEPFTTQVQALASSREALAILLEWTYPAVVRGVANLLLLLLFFMLTRNTAAALLVLFVFHYLAGLAGLEDLLSQSLTAVLRAALVLAVMFRVGLLATAVLSYVTFVFLRLPLTTDLSAWYAGASVLGLVVVIGLALYGFVVSLGGKPLFGRRLLEA